MAQISCDGRGKLWALSAEGDIHRRDVREVQTLVPLRRQDAAEERLSGGVLQDVMWNRMLCLSAHRLRAIEMPVKFVHFIASCSGHVVGGG